MKAYNFTRKDEINAVSATPLQNAKNEVVSVTGCALSERADEKSGETINVGYLVCTEYGTMTTISKTAIRGIELLIDYMSDENLLDCPVAIKASTSKSGREFITIEIK
mgnify:CR=1 FL=1